MFLDYECGDGKSTVEFIKYLQNKYLWRRDYPDGATGSLKVIQSGNSRQIA